MIRRIGIAAIFLLALGGCASYDPGAYGHRDGSYRGGYNDGYYAVAADGYGDYYYDRPEVVVNDFGTGYYGAGYYGYPYFGFGYGPRSRFGYDPWFYNPWYGYGYSQAWYRPWPHNHRRGNDHDADDMPGGRLSTGMNPQQRFSAAPANESGVRMRDPERILREPRRELRDDQPRPRQRAEERR